MPEERTHEPGASSISTSCSLILGPSFSSLLQRASRDTGALDVASDQATQIEVRRVTRQVVQGQFALDARDVILDDCFLMRRQSVDNEMRRVLALEHQFLEKRHKQLAGKASFVRCKPKGPLRVDSGRHAYALLLARAFDNRCFTTLRLRLAMHRVGAKRLCCLF